ncbi:MAG: hypothetical protein AB8D78_14785 [Akkermansiaceae bacterium]
MKVIYTAIGLGFLVSTPALSSTPVTFGPIKRQPGESLRLVAHSQAKDGTIVRWINNESSTGKIDLSRHRELHWTFRQPTADGSQKGLVKIVGLRSSRTVNFGGEAEKYNEVSPLTGKMFTLTKAPAADWDFDLNDTVTSTATNQDLQELKTYLKRKWYPDHPVKTGDSWEYDPKWIKMVVQRDLTNALTIGTMTLQEVRKSATRTTATIGISIQSSGEQLKSDNTLAEASVDLKGKMLVNLDTMLDESLELEGTVVVGNKEIRDSTKVTLPVRLIVTKTLFTGGGIP